MAAAKNGVEMEYAFEGIHSNPFLKIIKTVAKDAHKASEYKFLAKPVALKDAKAKVAGIERQMEKLANKAVQTDSDYVKLDQLAMTHKKAEARVHELRKMERHLFLKAPEAPKLNGKGLKKGQVLSQKEAEKINLVKPQVEIAQKKKEMH